MLGFVVRRLRGRLPLAAAVLLTVLITTTVLTALFAFTRDVGEAGLRQALQGPGRDRATVVVTTEHPAADRAQDDRAVRGFAGELFGRFPVGVESVARSRAYGLPGARAAGKDADLTLLAAMDRGHARLVAGAWPQAAAGPSGGAGQAPLPVAVPRAALVRLGLTEAALPAEVRLDDRYGGAPLSVLVTGVYRADDPSAPYWRLDPLGGRELQVNSFTTYGPLLVDDSAFGAGGLPQNSRASLLSPDFATVRTADTEALHGRAAALVNGALGGGLKPPAGFQAKSELADLLGEVRSGGRVARSTLLVGALQLTVLGAAALLLVAHLLTDRQEPERVVLIARGASRLRLGVLGTASSLLLALPAAVLAPLLAPVLLRLLSGSGPLSGVSPGTSGTWLMWPVAAACALGCVLLTALPAVLRGAGAAALSRAGRRQALVAGAVRSGADLAVVALALLAYQQVARYGGGAREPAAGTGGLGIDPVLVAAPTLALCAGTLLVLRLLPFAARLGGRLAERGRGLGPALVGWQLARRPGRATGPVLLLVLAVSSGVLALGQHTAWTQSQRDQADFATAGGLRISAADLAPPGRNGRYAELPGGDRLVPVVREKQTLPGGRTGQVLALDAAAVARRVPLRADLRDGQSVHELFAPLAADRAPGGAGIELPGRPRRIDLDVSVRTAPGGSPGLVLVLRDRFGQTFRSPVARLPESGDTTVSVDVDALAGAPLGSAAAPLSVAGFVFSYGMEYWGPGGPGGNAGPRRPNGSGELTVRGLAVSEVPGGAPAPVAVSAPGWVLKGPPSTDNVPAGEVLADAPGGPALLRLAFRGGTQSIGGVQLGLLAGPAPAAELPAIATRGYLAAIGAKAGDVVPVPLGSGTVPVRITAAVGSLPVAGDTALAVDLASAGRLLAADTGRELPAPTEWWLPADSAGDPVPAQAAAALRAGSGAQRVELREEVAAGLLDDPLSAGPQSALAALAVACAVLAAIGFAASSAAAGRERGGEFAVLLALGATRRKLARAAAAESAVLVGLGTGAGLALGAAIVHLVVPLMVLTPAAARPVPEVLVDLPAYGTLLMAAAIAAVPLLSAVVAGRRDRSVRGTGNRLRHLEDM